MSDAVRDVVIVGASAAGLTTAEALREGGFDGAIALVGDEPHAPYDRPPLSKQVLAGEWHPDRTGLVEPPVYSELDLELLLGRTATRLDLRARRVDLDDGRALCYDVLVIATGVRPRRLPGSGTRDGVHVLRTVDDAVALRDDLARAERVAVVGAGFLGCEVAAVARGMGKEVVLLAGRSGPLERALGGWFGRLLTARHRDHGVSVRRGVGVTGLLGAERVEAVLLADGSRIAADTVVVAIGSIPSVEWLRGSGLRLADGVVCDARSRAAPAVFAAGDVARWRNRRFGGGMRIEHRTNATEQALHVATAILGAEASYQPIPYLWSDQFGDRIQGYGIFPAHAEVAVAEGDPAGGRFVVRYVRGGRVVGSVGCNMPGAIRRERELIDRDNPVVGRPGR